MEGNSKTGDNKEQNKQLDVPKVPEKKKKRIRKRRLPDGSLEVIVPRVLKSDPRRQYASLFAKVYNSCDKSLIQEFGVKYCRSEGYSYNQRIYHSMNHFEQHTVPNLDKSLDLWYESMLQIPDLCFGVTEPKLIYRTNDTAAIKAGFTLRGTRFFSYAELLAAHEYTQNLRSSAQSSQTTTFIGRSSGCCSSNSKKESAANTESGAAYKVQNTTGCQCGCVNCQCDSTDPFCCAGLKEIYAFLENPDSVVPDERTDNVGERIDFAAVFGGLEPTDETEEFDVTTATRDGVVIADAQPDSKRRADEAPSAMSQAPVVRTAGACCYCTGPRRNPEQPQNNKDQSADASDTLEKSNSSNSNDNSNSSNIKTIPEPYVLQRAEGSDDIRLTSSSRIMLHPACVSNFLQAMQLYTRNGGGKHTTQSTTGTTNSNSSTQNPTSATSDDHHDSAAEDIAAAMNTDSTSIDQLEADNKRTTPVVSAITWSPHPMMVLEMHFRGVFRLEIDEQMRIFRTEVSVLPFYVAKPDCNLYID